MLTTSRDPLEGLNPEQAAAANHDGGPLCVLAGAGSGKTRVIERRVRVLLNRGIPPERILLLTFTKRAATEMRERLEQATPHAANITATTYHGFAFTLLRQIYPELGLERAPTVIDQDDAKRLLNQLAKERNTRTKPIQGKVLLAIHSATINRSLTLEDATGADYPDLLDRLDEISDIRELYRRRKREQHLVDFDDLLIVLHKALSNPEIAPGITDRYDHVLIDEFQDTNRLQGAITWLLAPHREVTIVADQDQAIYAFRGAHYGNLQHVLDQQDMTVETLNTNYRSDEAILDLANHVLGQMHHKHKKVLTTDTRPGGLPPMALPFKNAHDEAAYVTRHIRQLLDTGTPATEIAVLYRSSYLNIPLQAALLRDGIPFRTFGGSSLTSTAHIRDTLAFLRMLINPEDRLATARVLTLHPGIGPATADKISEVLTFNAAEELDELAGTARANQRESLHNIANLISHCWRTGGANEMIQAVIDYYLPIMDRLYDDPEQRRRDLTAFQEIGGQYQDLSLLVSDLMLDSNPDDQTVTEAVTLSTIHAAKGLEYSAVTIIGANDSSLPHYRAVNEGGPEGLNEERRLAYVAITRARETLLITYPTAPAPGQEDEQEISRFIQHLAPTKKVAA